jgi:hypothetical protein
MSSNKHNARRINKRHDRIKGQTNKREERIGLFIGAAWLLFLAFLFLFKYDIVVFFRPNRFQFDSNLISSSWNTYILIFRYFMGALLLFGACLCITANFKSSKQSKHKKGN